MKLQLSLMTDDKAKKELENDINEMTAMLDSYVSFVRGEAPEPIERIKLNEFIEDICKNIKIKDQKLITNINCFNETSGRPLQLKRSIMNILENSFRYAKEIRVDVSNNDENCYIEISDDGAGILEKNYEDVFKPFFTLDPSRNKLKGESGLGLTIARDIVRSHGGDIKLSKSDLGGLKTTINLPL
jgi:two-component system osmolarity sensor histidine kinase EnvZ